MTARRRKPAGPSCCGAPAPPERETVEADFDSAVMLIPLLMS
jgi:hypothetical protein